MTNTNFFEKVYHTVRLIPYGRVSSYGAIARFIGSPSASRMVGWAMNHSHQHDASLPAHRVVNRNGQLSGKAHFRHPMLMQELLENEGIKVLNDQVVDFKKLFWDPNYDLI